MGRWKGVKSNMKKDKNSFCEIYDMQTDERESMDVSAQYPELVKQFDLILKKHWPSHIREWKFVDPKY